MKLSSKSKIGLAILFFIIVMGFNWGYFGNTREGASSLSGGVIFAIILGCFFFIFLSIGGYKMYLEYKQNNPARALPQK